MDLGIPLNQNNPIVKRRANLPISEISESLDRRIQEYDIAAEADDFIADALENIPTAPFESDRRLANEIANRYRNTIEKRALTGDYENQLRSVRRDARKFASDINPLRANAQAYSEYVEGLEKLQNDGKIDKSTAVNSILYSIKNYDGIDPNNIEGTRFRGYNPVATVNLSEKAFDLVKNWEPNKSWNGIFRSQDGKFYLEGTTEQVNPNEVFNAVTTSLQSDYSDYIAQEVMFNTPKGMTPEKYAEQLLTNAVAPAAEKAGFTRTNIDVVNPSNEIEDINQSPFGIVTEAFTTPEVMTSDIDFNEIKEGKRTKRKRTSSNTLGNTDLAMFEGTKVTEEDVPLLPKEQKLYDSVISATELYNENRPDNEKLTPEQYYDSIVNREYNLQNFVEFNAGDRRDNLIDPMMFDPDKFNGQIFTRGMYYLDNGRLKKDTGKQFFDDKFDIDIDDVSSSAKSRDKARRKVGDGFTVMGRSNTGFNPYYPSFVPVSTSAGTILVDNTNQATPSERIQFDMFTKLNKNGGYHKGKFNLPQGFKIGNVEFPKGEYELEMRLDPNTNVPIFVSDPKKLD